MIHHIKKVLRKAVLGYKASSDAYITYLRSKGARIGSDVKIFTPNHTTMDLDVAYMISIGNNVNIEIYLPDRMMKFKVFSSYYSEPEDYAINTGITEAQYDEFIENLANKSNIDYGISPEQSNQILTLSTCDSTGKRRILIHAKLEEVYSIK